MTDSRDPQGFSEDNGPERAAGNDAPAETKPAEQLTEAEKAKKARRQRMLPLIFILLGVLCLAYPITSTVWNNHQTKLVSRAYENHVNNQSQELKDSYIARAREYNATHKGFPVLDPFLGDTAPDSTEYREYLSV